MRSLDELDAAPVATWTADEAFFHLTATFDAAAREHPDLMERYVTCAGNTDDRAEQIEAMRAGLRETFAQRFPVAREDLPQGFTGAGYVEPACR